MTAASSSGTAEALTARIIQVVGVRGLFPNHAVAAVAFGAIASKHASTALIGVDSRGGITRVVARLAIDRGTRSDQVIAEVTRIVEEFLGDDPHSLQIELAHID